MEYFPVKLIAASSFTLNLHSSTAFMNNLTKWLLGVPFYKIESYERLKSQILEHAKRDYLFFPFLIGYVERFLIDNNEGLSLKEMTLILIYELLRDEKIEVYFVDFKRMGLAKWETKEELNSILKRIKIEWDNCSDKDPDVNQVIWITSKESA